MGHASSRQQRSRAVDHPGIPMGDSRRKTEDVGQEGCGEPECVAIDAERQRRRRLRKLPQRHSHSCSPGRWTTLSHQDGAIPLYHWMSQLSPAKDERGMSGLRGGWIWSRGRLGWSNSNCNATPEMLEHRSLITPPSSRSSSDWIGLEETMEMWNVADQDTPPSHRFDLHGHQPECQRASSSSREFCSDSHEQPIPYGRQEWGEGGRGGGGGVGI
jgi:hypothetical protein